MNEILQDHVDRIKSRKYVWIKYYRDDDVLYDMPFESTNAAVDEEAETITVYNCIVDASETICLLDIYSVTLKNDVQEKIDTETWNKQLIDELKTFPKWPMVWKDFISEIPPELAEQFKYTYFSCDMFACRIKPEVAFLLCKLDVNSEEALMNMDLDVLKSKWKEMIIEHKDQATKVLSAEKEQAVKDNAFEDVEEIDIIFTLLDDVMSDVDENL